MPPAIGRRANRVCPALSRARNVPPNGMAVIDIGVQEEVARSDRSAGRSHYTDLATGRHTTRRFTSAHGRSAPPAVLPTPRPFGATTPCDPTEIAPAVWASSVCSRCEIGTTTASAMQSQRASRRPPIHYERQFRRVNPPIGVASLAPPSSPPPVTRRRCRRPLLSLSALGPGPARVAAQPHRARARSFASHRLPWAPTSSLPSTRRIVSDAHFRA